MLQHIAQPEAGLFLIEATNTSVLPDTPDGRQPHPHAFKANVLCKQGTEWEPRWCIRIQSIEVLHKLLTESAQEWVFQSGDSYTPLPEITILND